MATLGLVFGPWVAAAVGTLVGPAEAAAAHLNQFGPWSLRHTLSIVATSIFGSLALMPCSPHRCCRLWICNYFC